MKTAGNFVTDGAGVSFSISKATITDMTDPGRLLLSTHMPSFDRLEVNPPVPAILMPAQQMR